MVLYGECPRHQQCVYFSARGFAASPLEKKASLYTSDSVHFPAPHHFYADKTPLGSCQPLKIIYLSAPRLIREQKTTLTSQRKGQARDSGSKNVINTNESFYKLSWSGSKENTKESTFLPRNLQKRELPKLKEIAVDISAMKFLLT